MVSVPTLPPQMRRRLTLVTAIVAIAGLIAIAISFALAALAGPALTLRATDARAAIDTLRSYPAYAHSRVTREAQLTVSPERVAVCLTGGGVAVTRASGSWQLVSAPRGQVARALKEACR
jgi:hypothetical protein